MGEKPKVVVILGPTATGKTKCGVLLAQKIKGEIISGDSMLVYKNMNIATAKPDAIERGGIKHHLIDILEPNGNFNVVDFKQLANEKIIALNAKGIIPILVGGTGLYIKALLENYNFAKSQASESLRLQLENYAREKGNVALHAKLRELDCQTADRLHCNDQRRIIRAIEVALKGEEVSQTHAKESPYDAIVFGLNMERALLYAHINKRVDAMVEKGVFDETRELLSQGIPKTAQAMKSIGYRQIVQYLEGEITKEICIEKIKQATRNFAKRQITWYKKMPYVHWFILQEPFAFPNYVEQMYHILEEKWQVR